MSETVIPERWKPALERLQLNGLNGPYDDRFERQILEELGTAEQERDQLRAMLKRLEYQMSQCHICMARLNFLEEESSGISKGHAPDCELARLLGRVTR